MHKTWVCCRPREACRGRGFTLLELLVVLLLLALLTGMAMPRLDAWLRGGQERLWRGELHQTLSRFPLQAYHSGEALRVDSAALRTAAGTAFPDDLDLQLAEPLLYAANGMTKGGRLVLRRPGRADELWVIQALSGEVQIVASPN